MNIAICIKHVPVSNDVAIDPITHALVRENTEGMVNPADLNAIEEAVVLKEKTGAKIVVFTMGPADAEKSLRTALSMGSDEAVLITDKCFSGADTVATSKVLSRGLEYYGSFDLILTGAQTSDGATGQVGPMVAAQLNIPHISEAHSISYNDATGRIEVTRKFADNRVLLASSLPVLLTMPFGCNTPRFPTLRSKLAANKKEIQTYTNTELGLAANEVGLMGSPTEVVRSFQPEIVGRAAMLSGSAADMAKQILELIKKEKGNL